jgi:tRNA pseudouridine55 synthase
LARQGIVVEREARPITIYQLQLIEFTQDSLTLDVICSKGTYIRVLGEDIGEALGCGGI